MKTCQPLLPAGGFGRDDDDDRAARVMAAAVITRPNRVLDVGLAVAVIALGVGAYVAAGPPKTPRPRVTRTTTVATGVVLTSVQASGNVQAGSDLFGRIPDRRPGDRHRRQGR